MDPQQIMSRLKALASSLTPGQVASLLAAFVLVVGIVAGGAYWANRPTYALLYSDMEPDAASGMVTRLKTLKIDYVLDEGGRAIRVPASRVDELRLELASQGGLPESGRVGFEIFDRTNFGATEFLEQVNFRRALEGELARTIGTISEVASARVHIAMGKETLFGDPRPAKASVVLKLRGTRDLSNSTVNGISNLVAASVDGLRADNVVIVDSYGRPLARPSAEDNMPGGAAQLERQQRIEHEMGARVVSLLEPVLGPDHVRVNVAVRLNPTTVEQTEETYDPTTPAVRSKQTSSDSTTSATPGGGLAGVRGNQPPPAPDPKNPTSAQSQQAQAVAQAQQTQQAQLASATATASGASRSAETVNYEVNRRLVVTQRPPGEIARLSLAVIVDDEQISKKGSDGTVSVTRKPRSPEELQRLQGIVAAAVGLETDRGDQITVQNVSFEEPAVEEPQPLTRLQQVTQYSTQIWDGARLLAVVILGALAMIFFVRPLMRRAGAGLLGPGQQAVALAAPGQPLRTVADLESEIEAQLDASAQQKLDSRRLPVLARKVSTMTAKEPENVAKLLRSWINEGER
jgi:flagellar M-ring protein FliF